MRNLGTILKHQLKVKEGPTSSAEIAKMAADKIKFDDDNNKVMKKIADIKRKIDYCIVHGKELTPFVIPVGGLFNTRKWKNPTMIGEFTEKEHPHYSAIQHFLNGRMITGW